MVEFLSVDLVVAVGIDSAEELVKVLLRDLIGESTLVVESAGEPLLEFRALETVVTVEIVAHEDILDK